MRSTHLWHDSRILRSVRNVCLLAGVTLLVPAVATAQTWADAYKAGDYQRAAALLQPIVVAQAQSPGALDLDPAPARHLSILYARGSGVDRDPVLACGLARFSDMALHGRPFEGGHDPLTSAMAHEATIKESERFTRGTCDGLAKPQQRAASDSVGCFAFGMPEEKLTIGEQTIWVDRLGVRLSESANDSGASAHRCLQLVARFGVRTIAPPEDAAPGVMVRSFVELLGWQAMTMAGDRGIRYVLTWTMFELHGKKLEAVATEHLLSASTWPSAALPPDFDARFNVEMIRSGHVRWRFAGAPPTRGWIMLREGDSR
jgi:hypothetical protein